MSAHILLRLPPCIRQIWFIQNAAYSRPCRTSLRSFSNTRTLLGPQAKPAAPKSRRNAVFRPSLSHPSKNSSPPQARPPRPPPQSQPSATKPTYISLEQQLAATDIPLLIYRAPSHVGFRNFCLLASIMFGGYALNITNFAHSQWVHHNLANWVYYAHLFVGTAGMAIATRCVLAPMKMIRSVHIIPGGNRTVGPMLRLEKDGIAALLGRKTHVDVPSKSCDINHQFSASEHVYRNIGLPGKADGDVASARYRQGLRVQTRAPNPREILSMWMNKMFTRSGLTYMRVPGHGNWKLDVERCEMMDHGRIIDRLIAHDPEVTQKWWTVLSRK